MKIEDLSLAVFTKCPNCKGLYVYACLDCKGTGKLPTFIPLSKLSVRADPRNVKPPELVAAVIRWLKQKEKSG